MNSKIPFVHPKVLKKVQKERPKLVKVIKESFKGAGINKRVYPHLFRHSRATIMASHLTEFQMNQYFGWIQGSKMASTYVHLSGRDLDNALLEFNGMEVSKNVK